MINFQNILSYPQWQKVGICNHHGILLSLYSIREKKSSGIGEFLDLIPLIEWCKTIGFDVIQLLPLNDSGSDSSPFSSISSTALNPICLSLWDLPYLDVFPHHHDKLEILSSTNCNKRFNYYNVYHDKMEFLKGYFKACVSKISELSDYHNFIQENDWLSNYALFKVLKQHHHGLPWWQWDEEFKNPTASFLEDLKIKYLDDCEFYIFLQYLSFSQWQKVKIEISCQGTTGRLPSYRERCAECRSWPEWHGRLRGRSCLPIRSRVPAARDRSSIRYGDSRSGLLHATDPSRRGNWPRHECPRSQRRRNGRDIRPTRDGKITRTNRQPTGRRNQIRCRCRRRIQRRRRTLAPRWTIPVSESTIDRPGPPCPTAAINEPAAIVIRRPAPRFIRSPRPAIVPFPDPAARAVRAHPGA